MKISPSIVLELSDSHVDHGVMLIPPFVDPMNLNSVRNFTMLWSSFVAILLFVAFK